MTFLIAMETSQTRPGSEYVVNVIPTSGHTHLTSILIVKTVGLKPSCPRPQGGRTDRRGHTVESGS